MSAAPRSFAFARGAGLGLCSLAFGIALFRLVALVGDAVPRDAAWSLLAIFPILGAAVERWLPAKDLALATVAMAAGFVVAETVFFRLGEDQDGSSMLNAGQTWGLGLTFGFAAAFLLLVFVGGFAGAWWRARRTTGG